MLIMIPTLGRAKKQTTFDNLPKSIRDKCVLVLSSEEQQSYAGYPTLACPASGIGRVRQWMVDYALEQGESKLVMLDDDLVFARRRDDDRTKFRPASATDIELMFDWIAQRLDDYPHVSVSTREGGNRRVEDVVLNNRTLRVLAYDVDVLEKENIRFDQMQFMEDFYVSLSLLTRGYQNASINWIVQNQNGSDLPGGCSLTRTTEAQAAAAHALHAKFPDFVSVVQKQTKTAWGGKERTDVIIQWKKALLHGTSIRGSKLAGGAREAPSLLDQGTPGNPGEEGVGGGETLDG